MTPEEQRIAIAEACGWKRLEICRERILFHIQAKEYCIHHDGKPCEWLPDYLNDLNAMHEAEMQLIRDDPHAPTCLYGELCNVVNKRRKTLQEYIWPGDGYLCAWTTPAQRAEAFLRTIGKWKD